MIEAGFTLTWMNKRQMIVVTSYFITERRHYEFSISTPAPINSGLTDYEIRAMDRIRQVDITTKTLLSTWNRSTIW